MFKNTAILSLILTTVILGACSPSETTEPVDEEPISAEGLPINEADTNNPAAGGGAAAGAMLVGSNAIFMNPQLPGTTIEVTTVLLQEPGYVVIHESVDGLPGDVIGHSELLSTEAIEATVELDEAVEDGVTLFAMLHTDDGDGEYNFPGGDSPILDETTGEPIMMEFEVRADADEQPIMMP